MNYHPDHKVNRICQRIIDALRKDKMSAGELSMALTLWGYDVDVALNALAAGGHVTRNNEYKWELTQ